jgi:hypothetical protein
VFLSGKDMLGGGADFRSSCIGPGYSFGQRSPGQALLVDVAGEHASGEKHFVLL